MEEGRRGARWGLTAHRRLPGHGPQGGCGRGRTPGFLAAMAVAAVATVGTGTIEIGAVAVVATVAPGTAKIEAAAASAVRARGPAAPAAPPAPPATDAHQSRVLMLWGGITPGGQLRLDPAFVMDAPEKLPSAPGPYRLEVVGDGATGLLSLDFAMDDISDGGGGFLFMAPFREEWRGALERIVLTGPAGTATLDRDTRRPMAIVINAASGQIRAILRGAAAEARIAAAAEKGQVEAGDAVETADGTRVLVSYGLPGPH